MKKGKGNNYILCELVRKISSISCDAEHPWELIYKNLYEAMLKQPKVFQKEDCELMKRKSLNCIKNADATIKIIQLFVRLKYDAIQEDISLQKALDMSEVHVCSLFVDGVNQMTVADLKRTLAELLVFSYS